MTRKKKSKDNSEVDMDQKNTISLNKAILYLKYAILGKLLNLLTAQFLYLYSNDNLILTSEWMWKIYELIAGKTLIIGSAIWGMLIYIIIISRALCQDLVSE